MLPLDFSSASPFPSDREIISRYKCIFNIYFLFENFFFHFCL
ncbi:hypothetical protein GCWU000342_00766 [Shuttleworthella satelles DSM 14600]|uniref:Uncharacterized protein n=1 Tax=Shuttleworthella satelles DSM 14600 TaxID=626523 RepID=C4G9W2_9FIRM|nr:hypothetical protein GCWU000342_00766 [Shuttleworthia satelles DSM 14600]